jgi:exodeoxyribonuclease VII large subunit
LERIAADGRADVIIVGRGGGSAEDLMAFNEEAVARAIARMPVPVISAVGHETDVSIADLVADVRAATPSHAAELVLPDRTALLLGVDELGERVHGAMRIHLDRARERLELLRVPPPAVALLRCRQRVERAGDRLVDAMDRTVHQRKTRLATLSGQLHALSPKKVLGRGYAIVRRPDGSVVSRVADASVGARLQVEVQDGAWNVEVLEPGTP